MLVGDRIGLIEGNDMRLGTLGLMLLTVDGLALIAERKCALFWVREMYSAGRKG